MKRAFTIASALALIACYSGDGNGSSRNDEPASPPSSPVASPADGALRFFAASAEECTEEYARLGYCKPGPLTRCLTLENMQGEDLVCKVIAKAAVRSEAGSDFPLATRVFAVSREQKTTVQCFDFISGARARANFGYFTSFHGHCQRGSAATAPRFACDPETSRCTFFDLDPTTCQPGWPCHRIHIGRTMTTRKCTADLVASGVCAAGDPHTYACATVMNKGISPLKCDVRLNVARSPDAQPISSVFRGRLMTAGSQEALCFAVEGASDGTPGRLSANAVCRQMSFPGALSAICDVERASCEEESRVVTYVQ